MNLDETQFSITKLMSFIPKEAFTMSSILWNQGARSLPFLSLQSLVASKLNML